VILETLQEQGTAWRIPGLAERIDQNTQEVLRPESPAIGQHFFSILDALRKQDDIRRVPGVSDAIKRITQELDRDSFTTKHYVLSILESCAFSSGIIQLQDSLIALSA